MNLKRVFRKFKRAIKRGLTLAAIYTFLMIGILMMAERVERLEEKEKLQNECNVAIKIDK